jgi:hypothetical protein
LEADLTSSASAGVGSSVIGHTPGPGKHIDLVSVCRIYGFTLDAFNFDEHVDGAGKRMSQTEDQANGTQYSTEVGSGKFHALKKSLIGQGVELEADLQLNTAILQNPARLVGSSFRIFVGQIIGNFC